MRQALGHALLAWAVLGSDRIQAAVAKQSSPTGEVLELDHIYIWVSEGGTDAAAALRTAGLAVESEPTRHVGDGTSSISAVCENFYLELQYLDPSVSGGSLTQPEWGFTLLRAHWRLTGASPFGVGLRRHPGAPHILPFPTEASSHEWMHGQEIRQITSRQMMTLRDARVPDMFVVPSAMALPAWIDRFRETAPSADLLNHPAGLRRLTAARLVVDADVVKDVLKVVTRVPGVQVVAGADSVVELTFDGGDAVKDLRPHLPLVIRYTNREPPNDELQRTRPARALEPRR